MADGEINEVSAAIGGLKEAVRGLGDQIGSLAQQWMRQDDEASRGRRAMYEKINEMSSEIGVLKQRVEEMTPMVRAGEAARLRDSGARNILKGIWLLLVALAGAGGGALVNWFYRAPTPPHH